MIQSKVVFFNDYIVVLSSVKMVKKKIDNRIRVMIENGVKLGHRTMFLLVGDKSRDQVSFFMAFSYEFGHFVLIGSYNFNKIYILLA